MTINVNKRKANVKSRRGRKSPSRLTLWEQKFSKKLRKHHKHFAKKVFHRLMKKSSTLRSTLKRRSKEYEVKFEISLEEVREMLYNVGIVLQLWLWLIWHATMFILFLWVAIQLFLIFK